MTKEKGYCGWSNYEAYAVSLWMNSEEGEYKLWREISDEYEGDVLGLSARLEEEFKEIMPELSGVWQDLLCIAFDNIDWVEIAESMMER